MSITYSKEVKYSFRIESSMTLTALWSKEHYYFFLKPDDKLLYNRIPLTHSKEIVAEYGLRIYTYKAPFSEDTLMIILMEQVSPIVNKMFGNEVVDFKTSEYVEI